MSLTSTDATKLRRVRIAEKHSNSAADFLRSLRLDSAKTYGNLAS
jgi:hypothetical protein